MEWLNYHHLLYFWMVAREGTIALASEKLLLSQPTISTQIKTLEASLGEKLFERRGRRLVLTDTGQMVYGYANEIFSIGRELQSAVRQQGRDRPLRLTVGITDSLAKLVVHELLKPAFSNKRAVHLTCREGKIEPLLSDLAVHQLDVVLADTPGVETIAARTYSHLLGQSAVVFMAHEPLARKLRKGFPKSLHEAPALLPTPNFPLRRLLDRWFAKVNVEPQIVAEVEDSALTKVLAGEGLGFIAIPAVIEAQVQQRYRLHRAGTADDCIERFFAISVERRLKHPAVVAINESARDHLFA